MRFGAPTTNQIPKVPSKIMQPPHSSIPRRQFTPGSGVRELDFQGVVHLSKIHFALGEDNKIPRPNHLTKRYTLGLNRRVGDNTTTWMMSGLPTRRSESKQRIVESGAKSWRQYVAHVKM